MGLHFGELYHGMRGIVTFRLSRFALSPMGGFAKGTMNCIRRTAESAPYVIPPFAICFFLIPFIDGVHESYSRKNPDDYIDDE